MTLAHRIRGNDRGAIVARLAVAVALVAALAGVGSFAVVAPAGAAVVPVGVVTKVDICHAAGGSGNYVLANVDAASIDNLDPNGHGPHGADIIPPFLWQNGALVDSFAGRNWVNNLTNQEIYANDCRAIAPDLRLVKDSSGDALTGSTGSYTLTVSNVGTQTAVGPFTVTDTPPGGVTASAVSGTGWSCTLATLTCARTNGGDTLAPGASFPAITVAVTWTTAGLKVNSATVGTVTGETATANNTDTESDAITDPPVLTGTVVKTVSADAVPGYNATETAAAQGQTVAFRAVITNTSAVSVGLGSLTDSYGVVTVDPVSCTDPVPATLAPGASYTCEFSIANYSPAPGGSVTNTFRATLSRTGSVSVTPQGSATTRTAALVPVLSGTVDKTVHADSTAGYDDDETSAAPGSPASFRAVVTNTSGVQVDLGAMTDSYGAVVDAPVTCDTAPPATLAASGPAASFTCDFTLNGYTPTHGGAVVNTFKATLSRTGSTSVTPEDTATTRTGRPDLVMVKTSSGSAPAATSGSYFLDVSNAGSALAAGPLSVSDTMPNGVVATAVSGTGWACTVAPGGGSIGCSRAADLAPGAAAGQITVSVDWVTTGAKNNSATVSPVTGETITANNTEGDTSDVTAALVPDLKTTKTGPASRATGQTGSYSILVENVGTAAATAPITVTDTLPAGVSVAGPVSTGGFACTVVANVVTCLTNDDIGIGGTKTLTLPATFNTVGNQANTASASVAGDANAANNSSTWNTSVVDPVLPPPPDPDPADLSVQKTGPASVAPGGTVTWLLTVTNKGPGNASGFSVTDTLPAGVSLTSLTGPSFTCTVSTGVCAFTSVLLPAQTAVVTVVGSVSSAIVGTAVANVVVVGPLDATPADNTDTLVSLIDRPQPGPADLVLEKSAPADPAAPGESVVWTVSVTNAGASDAAGFTVTDVLTDGLTLASVEGDGFACEDGAPVSCTYTGQLAPGETATLVVTTLLSDQWRLSSVQNTAAAVLPDDPTPGNNTDSATAGVVLPIDGGTEEPGSGPAPSPSAPVPPAPSASPSPDAVDEPPAALPFTGTRADLLLGLGAGLSVVGLILALTGRRHRATR